MAIRKLIKFGKTSFIVSLPKSWVERNKLKKGDMIDVIEGIDEITLSANKNSQTQKKESKEIVINADKKSINEIRREIVANYIDSFNIITIIGKSIKDIAPEIKKIFHDIIALEIIEETSNKITVKDFIDVDKIQINELIRKMDIITRAMISDSRLILKDKTISVKNIYHRDEDVNRIYYLLLRIIKCAIINPDISRTYKLSSINLLSLWHIVFCIERIADEAKRIAKYLDKAKMKPRDMEKVLTLYLKIEDMYRNMMKGYYLKNRNIILDLADKKEELITECKKFLKSAHNKHWLPSALEKMKNMVLITNEIGRTLSQVSTLE